MADGGETHGTVPPKERSAAIAWPRKPNPKKLRQGKNCPPTSARILSEEAKLALRSPKRPKRPKNDLVLGNTRVSRELLELIEDTRLRLAVGGMLLPRSVIIREAIRRGCEAIVAFRPKEGA